MVEESCTGYACVCVCEYTRAMRTCERARYVVKTDVFGRDLRKLLSWKATTGRG